MLALENFGHYRFKFLEASTATVVRVRDDKEINEVIARNLASFMNAPGSLWRNPNALANQAKVSPSSVHNLLDPQKRTTTSGKPVGSPTVDLLQKVAAVFKREAWELLHPDLERLEKQRIVYEAAREKRTEQDDPPAESAAPIIRPQARPPLAPSIHEPTARYRARRKRSDQA